MKLYQNPNGDISFGDLKLIGDTDDGWSVNDGTPVPRFAQVEVVYRDGSRDPSLRADALIWNGSSHPRGVVAYRIITPSFQLELGGIYKARNGAIHGPLVARTDHPLYPFKTEDSSWAVNGRFFAHLPEHSCDLIERMVTPTLQLEVGGIYRDRGGNTHARDGASRAFSLRRVLASSPGCTKTLCRA
jgi:hypothetical protein